MPGQDRFLSRRKIRVKTKLGLGVNKSKPSANARWGQSGSKSS